MTFSTVLRGMGAAVIAFLGAGVVSAATLKETDFGTFSSDWKVPSMLGGVTDVAGTTSQNVHDIFAFSLPATAKTITLTFSAGDRMEDSYSAGTTVKYAFSPFKWGWDGLELGTSQIAIWSPMDKVMKLDLDDTFGGMLYLALYNTHGNSDYTITGLGGAPGRDEVPVSVPLPAGALLLGTTLGGMGLAAVRRRREKAIDA